MPKPNRGQIVSEDDISMDDLEHLEPVGAPIAEIAAAWTEACGGSETRAYHLLVARALIVDRNMDRLARLPAAECAAGIEHPFETSARLPASTAEQAFADQIIADCDGDPCAAVLALCRVVALLLPAGPSKGEHPHALAN